MNKCIGIIDGKIPPMTNVINKRIKNASFDFMRSCTFGFPNYSVSNIGPISISLLAWEWNATAAIVSTFNSNRSFQVDSDFEKVFFVTIIKSCTDAHSNTLDIPRYIVRTPFSRTLRSSRIAFRRFIWHYHIEHSIRLWHNYLWLILISLQIISHYGSKSNNSSSISAYSNDCRSIAHLHWATNYRIKLIQMLIARILAYWRAYSLREFNPQSATQPTHAYLKIPLFPTEFRTCWFTPFLRIKTRTSNWEKQITTTNIQIKLKMSPKNSHQWRWCRRRKRRKNMFGMSNF